MHGIILHEEYRERMEKLSPERLGRLVQNLFLVDDGKEPLPFPDDEALDVFSEFVCARLKRDIKESDKQRYNGALGGAPKGNQNARKQPKNNPKTTQKQPKNNPKQTPITNNLLPITNNLYKDILSYLNEKTGSHFGETKNNLQLINARLNDGYTVEDFKKVIDKKTKAWKTDSKMCKFLKPSTLFAPSHFDDYLNEPEQKSKANEGIETRVIDFDELERKLIKN